MNQNRDEINITSNVGHNTAEGKATLHNAVQSDSTTLQRCVRRGGDVIRFGKFICPKRVHGLTFSHMDCLVSHPSQSELSVS